VVWAKLVELVQSTKSIDQWSRLPHFRRIIAVLIAIFLGGHSLLNDFKTLYEFALIDLFHSYALIYENTQNIESQPDSLFEWNPHLGEKITMVW